MYNMDISLNDDSQDRGDGKLQIWRTNMRQPANMCAVRNSVVNNIGRKVLIKANRGRNKVDVTEGIISATYPSVFIIQVKDAYTECSKVISFQYADVLTREVEIVLC